MATYNVHAGHNYKVPGAGGCFSETAEARKVTSLVISKLRSLGHTVYDCTDEDGTTSKANLVNIVNKCNAHRVDVDISIHFNAFNGSAQGTEVLLYDVTNSISGIAKNVLNQICALGFTSRGLKGRTDLYVLRCTNSKAMLIECCFCDNAGDAAKYTAEKMATAIVAGLTGKTVSGGSAPAASTSKPAASSGGQMYRIRKSWSDVKSQIGAYKDLNNAIAAWKSGYYVYDKDGNVVHPKTSAPAASTSDQMYRVRKTWADIKSQLGAYQDLNNAKKNCPAGYSVFDKNGKSVYSVAAPSSTPTPGTSTADNLYRVRKTWADAKSQLGAYAILDNAKQNCPVGYSVFDSTGKSVYTYVANSSTPTEPTKPVEDAVVDADFKDISPLKGMSNDTFIEYIGAIAKEDMKKTGILASVTIAQAILESSWGQSELSLKANNLFGMKATLSGNNWDSKWGGKIYAKRSPEDDGNGNITQVLSDFRAYATPKQSIQDHSDYLCGAKNGSKLRYEGLFGETEYREAITIIKNGGYATDSKYIDKVCGIIEQYNLIVYDCVEDASDIIDVKKELENIKKEIYETKGILGTILNLLQSFFGKK